MKLSLFTDYAFRLLMQVAAAEPDLVTISTCAESYGISRHHLTKIANDLVRGGYLAAVRGRSGGLRLAKPAQAINVGDVVRYCESTVPLVECMDRVNNTCVITPACFLKSVLFEAESAFYRALAGYTLADLTARRQELRKILS